MASGANVISLDGVWQSSHTPGEIVLSSPLETQGAGVILRCTERTITFDTDTNESTEVVEIGGHIMLAGMWTSTHFLHPVALESITSREYNSFRV